jgi:triphosphoribosyl-dephospho-CoA synthase
MTSAADVAIAAQLACLLEASAPKPGNVSPGRHFQDARYEDFLASAAAIGAPLGEAGVRPVGTTVRLAVEATSRWTRSNTNLGIILLLAPLARAALDGRAGSLRADLGRVLGATTVDDAREVYAAIRLASPGGLGHADAQDVAGEPTMPLTNVMQLAAGRDGIAREYATTFETTFVTAVPALDRARRDHLSWDDAVIETFLTVLAANPDTHVARRGGAALADDISREAQTVLAQGGVRSGPGRGAIEIMDKRLRSVNNTANPGTTADLTAAAIFVVLLEGGWDAHGGRDAATR